MFLESLKLTLSDEKTLITNTRLSKVKFLGTYIQRIAPTVIPLARPHSAGNIRMTAPLPLITRRLKEKGFWYMSPRGPISKAITHLIPFPVKDLILRFRTILNGFLNYYSFADNICSLANVYYLLNHSLRSTICRKLDISRPVFLSIFGPDTTISIVRRDGETVHLNFPRPRLVRSPMKFQISSSQDPTRIKD